jgi:hypothetical protein
LQPFKNDFSVKKDLDHITKLGPEIRHDRLRTFLNKIKDNEESGKELAKWQMEFGMDVVKTEATVLATVKIKFNNVICLAFKNSRLYSFVLTEYDCSFFRER